MKNELNRFDPAAVAAVETDIWKAYYAGRLWRIPRLMLRAVQELYGIDGWPAARTAYHFTMAVIEFRLMRGRENERRLAGRLAKGMVHIAEHAQWRFDHLEAARREAHWWLVDRYPGRYDMRRWHAVARVAALIYNADESLVMPYAEHRVAAMVFHDDVEAGRQKENWEFINELLERSYRLLHDAVA